MNITALCRPVAHCVAPSAGALLLRSFEQQYCTVDSEGGWSCNENDKSGATTFEFVTVE